LAAKIAELEAQLRKSLADLKAAQVVDAALASIVLSLRGIGNAKRRVEVWALRAS
jgi:hypothetical protein